MKKLALTFLLLISAPVIAHADADLTTGLDALRSHDYTTAAANLQPLAADGNVEAAYRMCGMYYLGQGVPKNDAEAARFCHMAAERGHVDAMYNLALMYQKGEGVGQDLAEAQRWYAAAAAKGHPDARFNLKQIQLANTPGTNVKALELVHNAANNMSAASANRAKAAAAAAAQPQAPAAPVAIEPTAPVEPTPNIASKIPELAVKPVERIQPGAKPAVKAVAKPVQPPPLPPVPPVPPKPELVEPTMPQPPVMPVEPKAPATAATPKTDNSSTLIAPDIAKYCLMAAQRGHPDPGCDKENAPLNQATKALHPFGTPAPAAAKPQVPQTYLKPPEVPVEPLKPANLVEPKPVPTPVPTPIAVVKAAQPKPAEPVKTLNDLIAPEAPANADQAPSIATSSIVTNRPSLQPPEPKPAASAAKVPEHSLKWYISQANTGNPQAQNNLGVMYRRGINGAPKNIPEAIKWFERSASQGSVNGMINLGSIYKVGDGVEQNLELAYAWYNLAADRLPHGSDKRARAQQNVQIIAKHLTNEQIGDALQYVTELDENLPVLNEPVESAEEPAY